MKISPTIEIIEEGFGDFNKEVVPLLLRSGVLATTYSLEDYKAMAKMLFPHFYNNPKLWRILPNLGDTREWNSLQEVFDHLQKMADDEYNESLVGLKKSMIAG